ncbi:MAG TPA: hydrogen peroxide-inducible genes activator [Sedimenticola sp.]|nr:hydrogen peroxide-inducible genes activator [Sedimenticola sp.]
MTLNELRYAVAVARERHFGRAAEQCFISQPTLSVAVKKLEDELGVSLFERGQGEVSVTPAGERIIAQAQRVLEQAEAIKAMARQSQDQLAGPLRVAAIYTIGPYLFPGLVPALAERAPEMPLVIQENYTAVLSEQLKRGELDVIIISLPFDEPGVETRPLYREPFEVLLPASHPWVARDAIDPRDLDRERVLLLGQGHCFRDQVVEVCPGCLRNTAPGQGVQENFEGGSLETIRYMVASGIGITVLPKTAAALDRLPQGMLQVRPFAGRRLPSRTVALAWRRSFPRPEAVSVLAEAIQASGLQGVEMLGH